MCHRVEIDDVDDRRSALKHGRQEGYNEREGGSHTIVEYCGIINPVPRHNGKFKPGLRHGIQKTFRQMAAEKARRLAAVAVPVAALVLFVAVVVGMG